MHYWLCDNYALAGRHDEARELFERLLSIRNDLGLLSEEYDPRSAAPARQFPAGVLARVAGQHRAEPDATSGPAHDRERRTAGLGALGARGSGLRDSGLRDFGDYVASAFKAEGSQPEAGSGELKSDS